MSKNALMPLVLVATGLLATTTPAARAATQSLSFTILKEGEPIGKETYRIDRDGDHTTVELIAQSDVKIMFLNFHYRHRRSESWTGSHLDQINADTDDDGTKHHVEAQAVKGGIRLQADGKDVALPDDAMALTMWNKAILDHSVLYSVENADAPYKVTFKDIGPETLKIGGDEIKAEHYGMTGDVERDLWFGPDGMLVKVGFHRRGFAIEIIRD